MKTSTRQSESSLNELFSFFLIFFLAVTTKQNEDEKQRRRFVDEFCLWSGGGPTVYTAVNDSNVEDPSKTTRVGEWPRGVQKSSLSPIKSPPHKRACRSGLARRHCETLTHGRKMTMWTLHGKHKTGETNWTGPLNQRPIYI